MRRLLLLPVLACATCAVSRERQREAESRQQVEAATSVQEHRVVVTEAGEVRERELGAWDELVFAEPDGGELRLPATAAVAVEPRLEPLRLEGAVHHPAERDVDRAPVKVVEQDDVDAGSFLKSDSSSREKDKSNTDVEVGVPRAALLWGAVAAGGVALLYRFRKVVPFVKELPWP